jgi:hypothetical protein
MINVRALGIAAVGLVLGGSALFAQDLFRYRDYTLDSSLRTVVTASGSRADDVRMLLERPARIQELEWNAPYARAEGGFADPVRNVVFAFCDDQLYQVVVTYDRDRTEGLTNDDIVEALSAAYGLPLLPSSPIAQGVPAASAPMDTVVVARWEDATSALTLLRGRYAPQYQLVLVSKSLATRAQGAIKEGIRLDAVEAPQREAAKRNQDALDDRAAGDKARTENKAAFRP